VEFVWEYENGKRKGKGKEYDDNESIEFEGEYANGKRWNGKGYNKDGQEEFQLKKGYAKNVKEYYSDG